MNAAAEFDWLSANQRLLVAEFASLRLRFDKVDSDDVGASDAATASLAALRAQMLEPAAIDHVAEVFGLSAFERAVLLLAAGVEMDAALARCVPRLSFDVALAALPGAHWSALAPQSPLRAWRLVELDDASVTHARLRIDERILHLLAGVNQMDTRVLPLLKPLSPPMLMAATHRQQLQRLLGELQAQRGGSGVVQLCGDDADGCSDVACELARAAGLEGYALAPADLPPSAAEQQALATLWQREALLLPAALLIRADEPSADTAATLARFVQRVDGLVMVSAREPLPLPPGPQARIDKPDAQVQHALWRQALNGGEGGADLAADLPALQAVASQFRLSAGHIQRHAQAWRAARDGGSTPDVDGLWQACSAGTRPRLDLLAQRIDAVAGWDDLVLPQAAAEMLRELVAQARHRLKVYGEWGFASQGTRGLGLSALFCGESGTGKTMACEVVARELALDLYRVDLSGVVSKYIGETEKNLRRVFDAAEDSGAILLFDEADALFGKRSEVKDSHDRYANIEVSYLLQRMEAYRGLAVLTSNLRGALDPAFQRRLRFIVPFTFPDEAARVAMWQRVFPAAMPRRGLEIERLARLHLTGGQIRNIALNAAFLAAADDAPVTMAHLARSVRNDSAKQNRPLPEQQLKDWA